jgi:D-glycero-D-manno-heptose 1,7-bisphosphate phosphatase
MPGRPAVFLDRDGVVNETLLHPRWGEWMGPHRPEDVRLRPDVPAAIRRLRALGWPILVASNQPDVAKAKCSREALDAAHAGIVAALEAAGAALDGFYYCYHHPTGAHPELSRACACRKPAPGLLEQAAAERGIDLARSWMVGDRETDVECGRRAGCRTILVRYAHTEASAERCRPDHVAADLAGAAERILEEVSAHAGR